MLYETFLGQKLSFVPQAPWSLLWGPGHFPAYCFCGEWHRWNRKTLKEDRGEKKVPAKALAQAEQTASGLCVARGRDDTSGAFPPASCRILPSYIVKPLHKRINHKLIILKKINTNDSCLYIAWVVLTYISRLGSPGLHPAVLICFYLMPPEAS